MSTSDRNTNAAYSPSDGDDVDDGAFPEIPVRPRARSARMGDPVGAANGSRRSRRDRTTDDDDPMRAANGGRESRRDRATDEDPVGAANGERKARPDRTGDDDQVGATNGNRSAGRDRAVGGNAAGAANGDHRSRRDRVAGGDGAAATNGNRRTGDASGDGGRPARDRARGAAGGLGEAAGGARAPSNGAGGGAGDEQVDPGADADGGYVEIPTAPVRRGGEAPNGDAAGVRSRPRARDAGARTNGRSGDAVSGGRPGEPAATDEATGRRGRFGRFGGRRKTAEQTDPVLLVTDSDAVVEDDRVFDEDMLLGEDFDIDDAGDGSDADPADGGGDLELGATTVLEDEEVDEEELLDELIFNYRRNRWEHPATRSWWNDKAQRWEQKTGAPAPPAWTPPSLALETEGQRPRQPKIKKLRLALMLSGFGVLAACSTLFGMLMAIASDLPALENRPVERNSVMLDHKGKPLGLMTGRDSRILLTENEIPYVMKRAIIAIEDRRFYENDGVDLKAVGRALVQDVVSGGKAVQGGSTITMQFVKNALRAQKERTILQKVRESALAYHLTRKWTKGKILKEYLNSIYFGNGAYGLESAARTYFRWSHPNCGNHGQPRCATLLQAHEAALIAGVVSSPSAYDPVAHPRAARKRRNQVLRNMRDQDYLTRAQYAAALAKPIPREKDIHPPRADTDYPYFASWVRQQVVDKMGSRKAFGGGLRITTTLDVELQQLADNAVRQWMPPQPGGPRAALVALDNRTGQVRAMVGGDAGMTKEERLANFAERPFNLATQGQRQPGSIFKPFVFASALGSGISPDSTWASKKLTITVPGTGGQEKFTVNNYEDNYSGVTTLRNALTFSDNSVFVQAGMRAGTRRVSRMISRMGVRTPVSRNYAVALGAPKAGVTVLDMAHAYQTFATGGRLRYGRLSPGVASGGIPGPSGIEEIREPVAHGSSKYRLAKLTGGMRARDETMNRRVLPEAIADETTSVLTTVLKRGTGKRADLGSAFAAGKTGTTENYGDAWFAGFTKDYTVVVWVGYPDNVRPMKPPRFGFRGEPVAGGTYPALIWRTFLQAALQRNAARRGKRRSKDEELPETTAPDLGQAPVAPPTGQTAPEADGGGAEEPSSSDRPDTPGNAPSRPRPSAPPSAPPASGSPPIGGAPAAPGAAPAPGTP